MAYSPLSFMIWVRDRYFHSLGRDVVAFQDCQDRCQRVELQLEVLHVPHPLDVLVPAVELLDGLLPHEPLLYVLLGFGLGVEGLSVGQVGRQGVRLVGLSDLHP